jgi:glycosyltransferase involved in cell wall biosynthesis
MPLLFTVAVPAYNRASILKTSLEIILQQIISLEEAGELLVIDDGSSDGTKLLLEAIKEKYPENFRYLIQEQNQGIAKTRNALVKNSAGKFIIFTDSDVIPSDNLVKAHLKVLRARKNIISQGSLILVPDENEIPKKKFNPLTDFSRAFFDTANVAVEKEKIIEAGYFDENFTGYGWEDLELGIRLRKKGLRVVRNKPAYAYHIEPLTKLDDISGLINKEIARAKGAVYFAGKHPLLEVKLMTQLTFFHLLLDDCLTKFLGLEKQPFLNYLAYLEKEKRYNWFIPLLRLYLNHFNVSEIRRLIKHN